MRGSPVATAHQLADLQEDGSWVIGIERWSRSLTSGSREVCVMPLWPQCTHMGSEGKKRVQFRAPRGLISRADALATVLDTDRTDVLTDALAEYLRDASHDDDLIQEIADAYYDDDIGFEQLQALVGHEEAANVRVLKDQLSDEFINETAAELSNP